MKYVEALDDFPACKSGRAPCTAWSAAECWVITVWRDRQTNAQTALSALPTPPLRHARTLSDNHLDASFAQPELRANLDATALPTTRSLSMCRTHTEPVLSWRRQLPQH